MTWLNKNILGFIILWLIFLASLIEKINLRKKYLPLFLNDRPSNFDKIHSGVDSFIQSCWPLSLCLNAADFLEL